MMSKLLIKLAEGNITEHLLRGGTTRDDEGKRYISEFATKALSDSDVLKVAKDFEISHQDICEVCAAMIDSLMPNPCYGTAASRTLVPTLFFIETFRFQGLASSIYSRTKGLPLDERSEMIALICEADAKQTFQVHKAHFGEPPFIIQQLGGLKKTGCLSVLIAGLIGTSIPLGLVLYEALGWS